jgi:2'-5' RNA ligase
VIRLFVAIPLPVDVRAQLGALQSGLSNARWIDKENMHLTMRFIGEVHEPDVQEIDSVLSQLIEPAIPVELHGLGYFERRGRAHSVWVRIKKSDALVHLQAKIERTLVTFGLEPEKRKYTPHVTLARIHDMPVERLVPWLSEIGDFSVPVFMADQFVLVETIRGHGGATYTPIARYDLFEPL